MDLKELKFWFDVVLHASIPENGNILTSEEKLAVEQSCRVLASTALYIADKITKQMPKNTILSQ